MVQSKLLIFKTEFELEHWQRVEMEYLFFFIHKTVYLTPFMHLGSDSMNTCYILSPTKTILSQRQWMLRILSNN